MKLIFEISRVLLVTLIPAEWTRETFSFNIYSTESKNRYIIDVMSILPSWIILFRLWNVNITLNLCP